MYGHMTSMGGALAQLILAQTHVLDYGWKQNVKYSLNHLFEIISLLFEGFIWFRGKFWLGVCHSKSNILTHHSLSVASWIFSLQVQRATAHVETDTVIDEAQQKMRKTGAWTGFGHEQKHWCKAERFASVFYGCNWVNQLNIVHTDVSYTER